MHGHEETKQNSTCTLIAVFIVTTAIETEERKSSREKWSYIIYQCRAITDVVIDQAITKERAITI